MTWPKQAGHTWRFSKVRTRASDNPSTEVAATSGPNVTATETWEQMLGNLDGAWRTWSREAETWLLATNRLSNRAPERFLGEVPTIIVPGSHHVAPNQGISERQLRRKIRRLDETLFWLGEARQSLSLSSKMFSEAVSRKPNLAPSVRESGARLETLLKADFRTFWLLKVVRLFQSGNKGSTLSQELANGCGRTWRSLMWLKMTPVKF
jgi:hypothetical protein